VSSDRIPGQRFAEPPSRHVQDTPNSAGAAQTPPPQSHLEVQQYRKSGRILPVAIGIGVAVLIGALITALIFANRPDTDVSGATPSSNAPTPSPVWYSPAPGVNGTDFGNDCSNSTGIWEITKATWDRNGLTLNTRIQVQDGTLSFEFAAFDNANADYYTPDRSSTMSGGRIPAGKTAEGTVRFQKSRGDTNVMLTGPSGICSIATLKVTG
jgi:hypothetical protein